MESITSKYQKSSGDLRLAALDLDCLPEWNSALIALGGRVETVARPEYLASCEAGGWGRAEALVVANDESLFYMSTLRGMRTMHGQLVSGFHAPLMVNGDVEFLRASLHAVESYWQQQKVVGAVLAVGTSGEFTSLGTNWSLHESANSTTVDAGLLVGAKSPDGYIVQSPPNLARSMDVFVEMARACGGAGYEGLLTDDYAGALLWEMGDLLSLYACYRASDDLPCQTAAALWSRTAVHVMLANSSADALANQAVLSAVAHTAVRRGAEIILPSFSPPMCPASDIVGVNHGVTSGFCLATWRAARQNITTREKENRLSGLFAAFAA